MEYFANRQTNTLSSPLALSLIAAGNKKLGDALNISLKLFNKSEADSAFKEKLSSPKKIIIINDN